MSLLSSDLYGQHTRLISDTVHYCLTENLTKFLLNSHRDNLLNGDKILEMVEINDSLEIQVYDLKSQNSFSDILISVQDSTADIDSALLDLTEREMRRRTRKARSKEIWAKIKVPFIFVGGVIVGVAGGYAIGTAK